MKTSTYTLTAPVYKYSIKLLQDLYAFECSDDQFILHLKSKDDLYFPCRYAVGKPHGSNFTSIIDIITIKFAKPLENEPDTLEYAVGNIINKMANSYILRMQREYASLLNISELEALKLVLERYNIYEDEYAFESNHKAFIRYKKHIYHKTYKRYREGFKKKIVKEIMLGNISYRVAQKKYNIKSHDTIRRWIKQYGEDSKQVLN